ncbi:retropepsin-like aspartic protease [Novosphingobium sp.]|uniref:retropepsin-like aspartic protease n=1 Tax=Novosphingobium sp. TaxID=1874826 RepID=UPI0025F09A61|nr:retropepsin-like aspartic protease [Novosphingobium sp.]
MALPDKAALVRVPFTTVDGRIYVEARVNGTGPFRFGVDTGASGMGRADASLARELQLPADGSAQSTDGLRTSDVDQVRIGTLEIGRLVRRNIAVISRDYRSRLRPEAMFAGIFGREFFAGGLLVIDYPNRTLSFTRARGLRPEMAGAVPYERAFRVPVRINGITATGNLDTGANVSFVMPKAFYQQISREPLLSGPAGDLMNSKIQTERGHLGGPILIGQARLDGGEVRASEQFPELLIGALALQKHAILIDQRTRLVALCTARRR